MAYHVSAGVDSFTNVTLAQKEQWLGNGNEFVLVDTPGITIMFQDSSDYGGLGWPAAFRFRLSILLSSFNIVFGFFRHSTIQFWDSCQPYKWEVKVETYAEMPPPPQSGK